MRERYDRIDETPHMRAEQEAQRIYTQHIGNLNRAERRTAQGRRLVAEAEAAALREKVRILEEYIAANEIKAMLDDEVRG